MDELVDMGCITKVASQGSQQEPAKEEEVVYDLDDYQYQELQAKVGESIEILKADKLNIFKIFADVDKTFGQIDGSRGR